MSVRRFKGDYLLLAQKERVLAVMDADGRYHTRSSYVSLSVYALRGVCSLTWPRHVRADQISRVEQRTDLRVAHYLANLFAAFISNHLRKKHQPLFVEFYE